MANKDNQSNRSGGAKLLDVARAADCSPATVSRVMNNNPTVGQTVRDRVLQVAAELGYVANGSARALRSAQARLVGAVIPTVDHTIYASMIDALQTRLGEKNVSLILSTSMYDLDLEFEQVRLLIEHGVETVVLVGAKHKPQTIAMLEQRRLPYVCTYTAAPIRSGAAIGFDNEKAGRIAARFLLDLGHRRLAMIAGITQGNDRAAGRLRGFIDEAGKAGIEPESIAVVEAPYTISAGAEAMKTALEHPGRPTAVFCGSDILAAGALRHCAEANIQVPNQVSVLGFDNLEIAEITSPDLSTLEVPAREMGRLAGDYALASPTQRLHLQRTELPIRLIVRTSTGPVRSMV